MLVVWTMFVNFDEASDIMSCRNHVKVRDNHVKINVQSLQVIETNIHAESRLKININKFIPLGHPRPLQITCISNGHTQTVTPDCTNQ